MSLLDCRECALVFAPVRSCVPDLLTCAGPQADILPEAKGGRDAPICSCHSRAPSCLSAANRDGASLGSGLNTHTTRVGGAAFASGGGSGLLLPSPHGKVLKDPPLGEGHGVTLCRDNKGLWLLAASKGILVCGVHGGLGNSGMLHKHSADKLSP